MPSFHAAYPPLIGNENNCIPDPQYIIPRGMTRQKKSYICRDGPPCTPRNGVNAGFFNNYMIT